MSMLSMSVSCRLTEAPYKPEYKLTLCFSSKQIKKNLFDVNTSMRKGHLDFLFNEIVKGNELLKDKVIL
jgi:hypothetical protein